MPLLPLWAVRPVQSLSFCTGVTFTFYHTFDVSPTATLEATEYFSRTVAQNLPERLSQF